MLKNHLITIAVILLLANSSFAMCYALFQRTQIVEQQFTSLEIDRKTQKAVRKYSVFDILRIRRDIQAHQFIRNELELPAAFLIPEVLKSSVLRLEFSIPKDAQPLREHIDRSDVKTKFDLALNLMMKQIGELSYPWSYKLARRYLSLRNTPKLHILSRSEAKREILFNNNIVFLIENSTTKENLEIHMTLDSFLYSPSSGQLIFSALY